MGWSVENKQPGQSRTSGNNDEVYRKAYENVSHARESLGRFIAFYNARRPHSSLDAKTPDEVYFATSTEQRNAA